MIMSSLIPVAALAPATSFPETRKRKEIEQCFLVGAPSANARNNN
jgi:hypothetical protein